MPASEISSSKCLAQLIWDSCLQQVNKQHEASVSIHNVTSAKAREMPVPASTSSNSRRERGMWYSLVTRVTCWTLCFSRMGNTKNAFSMVFFACRGASQSCNYYLGKWPRHGSGVPHLTLQNDQL